MRRTRTVPLLITCPPALTMRFGAQPRNRVWVLQRSHNAAVPLKSSRSCASIKLAAEFGQRHLIVGEPFGIENYPVVAWCVADVFHP